MIQKPQSFKIIKNNNNNKRTRPMVPWGVSAEENTNAKFQMDTIMTQPVKKSDI